MRLFLQKWLFVDNWKGIAYGALLFELIPLCDNVTRKGNGGRMVGEKGVWEGKFYNPPLFACVASAWAVAAPSFPPQAVQDKNQGTAATVLGSHQLFLTVHSDMD